MGTYSIDISETSKCHSALITGATGFVGAHLTKHLVKKEWRVSVVTRQKSSLNMLDCIMDKIKIHEHDSTTEGMKKIMETAMPDVVFHLASLFISEHQHNDVVPLIQSNILFGSQLLEAMSYAGTRKLVNIGTSWQHFEDKEYCPVNLYAATKQAFEDIIQYYVETAHLKAVTLKLYDTYGPQDTRHKLLSLLIESARTGCPLRMSPGEQLLDLVHVYDVVNACIDAFEHLHTWCGADHKSFAVRTGEFIRLIDIVALFERFTQKKLNIQFGQRPYRPREVMKPWEGGEYLPGWSPKISLETGISELLREQAIISMV